MANSWEASDERATYEVRIGSDDRIAFSAAGAKGVRTGIQGESEEIWVEEFPENERWQNWIRERLGERELVEIQNAVASELEELSANRKAKFAGIVEDLYGDDPDDRVRAIARIRSLAERYGDLAEHAVEELADSLEEDHDEVRRASAEAIRRIAANQPDAVGEVREVLRRALGDEHPNVRLDAARAFVLLAETEGDAAHLPDQVLETLVGLLHEHTRWFSKGPVAGLLGELGRQHPDVVEPAVEPLARFVVGELSSGSGTSGIGRSTAVQALVEIGNAEPALIADYANVFFDKLSSRRPGVRGHCAEALGLLGSRDPELAEQAVAALRELLGDNDFVRSAAVDGLRQIRRSHPDPVEDALGADQLATIDDEVEIPV